MDVLNYFGKTNIYIIEEQVITGFPGNEMKTFPVFLIPCSDRQD